MGWFWTDTTSSNTAGQSGHAIRDDQMRTVLGLGSEKRDRQDSGHDRIAPHPMPIGDVQPPPECPMHNASALPSRQPKAQAAEGCPYKPGEKANPATLSTAVTPSDEPTPPPRQPSYISKLNPLNYMPESISNRREAAQQSVQLPLSREPSSIPRGDGSGNWEYPSPQQMYNAMLRKGYTDTPAEHVESMVAVHNFLNEGAWEEIREWERRFSAGLGKGWDYSKSGEEGAARRAALDELRRSRQQNTSAGETDAEPKLLRFMGRPNDTTPKARMLGFMSWLYPAMFPDNPPFDRHDWFVQRHAPGGASKEIRYVIDYYSGPPEPTGEPVFYLDVRPAVDGPTAACERMLRWGGDVWYRASGAGVREGMERRVRGRQ